jgi:hypothetical protein
MTEERVRTFWKRSITIDFAGTASPAGTYPKVAPPTLVVPV